MKFNFAGKRAVVCGSTQGMGKSTALLFSDLGAEVVLVARNIESLEQTKSELSDSNGQSHDYLCTDFSKPEELRVTINGYVKNSTPIHILVNNTGGPSPEEIVKAESEHFIDGFNKHLICNQFLTQALIPGMKSENYGRIINIISTSVKQPIKGLGVSNTIRGAVASWAKTLAGEVAPYGITVNNILPGATNTERLHSLFQSISEKRNVSKNEVKTEWVNDIPAGRIAEPEEMAYAICFLASEYAGYINGINLPVDGGRLQCL
ncbi:MAG: SDR family oxidoreductase [Candidatus Marinimicrobia bacterium]|jgi:3-oxoacyl-[acyl-carrier protein] reductase|nr:SDR family oxidoreductase [Candidatus Neomarinimicrobiota bacterium]